LLGGCICKPAFTLPSILWARAAVTNKKTNENEVISFFIKLINVYENRRISAKQPSLHIQKDRKKCEMYDWTDERLIFAREKKIFIAFLNGLIQKFIAGNSVVWKCLTKAFALSKAQSQVFIF
jgi:hypothetical protein